MQLFDASGGPTRTQLNRMSDMSHVGLRHDVFLECDVRKACLFLVVL